MPPIEDPAGSRSSGLRFQTALGSFVQLCAREGSSYHFVEWGPEMPARHTRVHRDHLWELLEGAELMGKGAEA